MNYFTSYFKSWFRHGVRLTTSKQLISDILTSPKITTRTQRVRFLIWTVRFEFAAWYSDVDHLPLIKGCNGRRTNQIPDYQLHSFHLWNPWKHVDHSSVCPWQKPAKKSPTTFSFFALPYLMCWLTSPEFGLGDLIRRPSNEVPGTILCPVFWSRVFLFQLLFFTVYITFLLTIERWVAVVKPSNYDIAFKGKRLTGYLIFCWIWSFFLTGEGILDSVYEPNSSSHDICTVKFIFSGSILRASQTVLNIIMKTFFPCLSTIGLYVHMIVTTNNFPVASAASKAKLRVTRKDD